MVATNKIPTPTNSAHNALSPGPINAIARAITSSRTLKSQPAAFAVWNGVFLVRVNAMAPTVSRTRIPRRQLREHPAHDAQRSETLPSSRREGERYSRHLLRVFLHIGTLQPS